MMRLAGSSSSAAPILLAEARPLGRMAGCGAPVPEGPEDDAGLPVSIATEDRCWHANSHFVQGEIGRLAEKMLGGWKRSEAGAGAGVAAGTR